MTRQNGSASSAKIGTSALARCANRAFVDPAIRDALTPTCRGAGVHGIRVGLVVSSRQTPTLSSEPSVHRASVRRHLREVESSSLNGVVESSEVVYGPTAVCVTPHSGALDAAIARTT